jgi:hypothetical protein
MRQTWGWITMLALGTVPAIGHADSPPMVFGLQEVGAKEISSLNIDCNLDYNSGGTKAVCTFISTYVNRPSAESVKKELADVEATLSKLDLTKPESQQGWDKLCKSIVPSTPPDPKARAKLPELELKQFDLYVEACRSKSAERLKEAFQFGIRLKADTCSVHTGLPKTQEFTKKNENVWEGIDTGGLGGNGGTVVMTIWRAAGGSGLWNYREVRAGEVNCKPNLLSLCREPGIVEWRWDKPKPILQCKYVSTS